MHGRRLGAAALPASLLPLLLLFPGTSLGASPMTAGPAMYIRESAFDFSYAAGCGDRGSLKHCLGKVSEPLEVEYLRQCFINAGCNDEESNLEADRIVKGFYQGNAPAEMRRRSPDPTPAPTPAPAETTSAKSAGGFKPSIECSSETVVKTQSCPIQSTGSESGKTLPCFEAEATQMVCKAENICSTDKDGNNLCMLRKNQLDTGEIVVTVFLGTVFGLGFAALLFFCCRDKAAQRKRKARAEAAQIAKTAAANATSATMAVSEESAIPPKREPSVGTGGHNPFTDASYDAPPAQAPGHY
ncbi:hypothetical protein Daesc_001135 [Daldinia eschscholtzii]|uniref:Uncharacterized protein n=1 Tax=Daldinia eschscholtzii TaxID=292717 RepID=A0AAX6N0P0_9PEZI